MQKNNILPAHIFEEIQLQQRAQSLILSINKKLFAYIPDKKQLEIIAFKKDGMRWKKYFSKHFNYNQKNSKFELICFNKNNNQILIHRKEKYKIYQVDLKEQSLFSLSKIFGGDIKRLFCFKEYQINLSSKTIDCSFDNQFILIGTLFVYLLLDVNSIQIKAKFVFSSKSLNIKILFFSEQMIQIHQGNQVEFLNIKTQKAHKRLCFNEEKNENFCNLNIGAFISFQKKYSQSIGIVWNLAKLKKIRKTILDKNYKSRCIIGAIDRFALQHSFVDGKASFQIIDLIFLKIQQCSDVNYCRYFGSFLIVEKQYKCKTYLKI